MEDSYVILERNMQAAGAAKAAERVHGGLEESEEENTQSVLGGDRPCHNKTVLDIERKGFRFCIKVRSYWKALISIATCPFLQFKITVQAAVRKDYRGAQTEIKE